jgi:hypothetical protein
MRTNLQISSIINAHFAWHRAGEDYRPEWFDAEVSVVKRTRGFWRGFADRFWARRSLPREAG